MKKLLSTGISVILLASTVAASVADAAPRGSMRDRERLVVNYCNGHRGDRDCRGDRRNWDERRYNSWYNNHRGYGGNGAAALFGLATGAIVGAAVAGSSAVNAGHVARCDARYRSYDVRTDTYVINSDGDRARCRL